jgi:hypothetical protein
VRHRLAGVVPAVESMLACTVAVNPVTGRVAGGSRAPGPVAPDEQLSKMILAARISVPESAPEPEPLVRAVPPPSSYSLAQARCVGTSLS